MIYSTLADSEAESYMHDQVQSLMIYNGQCYLLIDHPVSLFAILERSVQKPPNVGSFGAETERRPEAYFLLWSRWPKCPKASRNGWKVGVIGRITGHGFGPLHGFSLSLLRSFWMIS